MSIPSQLLKHYTASRFPVVCFGWSLYIRRGMIRCGIMFLTCIVVAGTLTMVLLFFFRRLNRLERERWGDKAKADTEMSLWATFKHLFKRRKK